MNGKLRKTPAAKKPQAPKPLGEQAIGSHLYALIRQAILEIKQ